MLATLAQRLVAALRGSGTRRPPRLHVHAQGLAGRLDVYDATWEDGRPVRVLATGTTLQSAVYTDGRPYDPVFEYYVLYDLMFEATSPVRRVLMLGGGGYAYPRYLLHAHPEVRMDVVELDPAVTRLARRYLGLDQLEREVGTVPEGRLGLFEGDARTFLERTDARYDVILNDCFSGDEPAASLCTVEAAQLAHARLRPGGAFLSNVVSALEGPRGVLLRALARTYGQAFAHVYVVPAGRNAPNENDNNLLVATDEPFAFPAAREVAATPSDPVLTDASPEVVLGVIRRTKG